MVLPEGHSQQDVLDAIERCVAQFAGKFVFGHVSRDDAAQQARLFAWELVQKGRYDPTRGSLLALMARHVRRRLINWKRDLTTRFDSPCARCFRGDHCREGQLCEAFRVWKARQDLKRHVRFPKDIALVDDREEPRLHEKSSVEEDVAVEELLRLIDENLPVELRSLYLRLKAGCKNISKADRDKVETAVREILGADLPMEGDDD